MKIAILFSGHIREYSQIYPFFKERILEPISKICEYDIFFHTWDIHSTLKCWASTSNRHSSYNKLNDKIDVDDLVKLYNPKKYLIENFNDKYNTFLTSNFTPQSYSPDFRNDGKIFFMTSMFYGIYKVNELKKQYELQNNFKYDKVVRQRFDSILDKPLNAELLKDNNNHFRKHGGGHTQDVFWICNSDISDIVSSIFLNMKTIFNGQSGDISPEQSLDFWISKNKIPVTQELDQYEFLFHRDQFGLKN